MKTILRALARLSLIAPLVLIALPLSLLNAHATDPQPGHTGHAAAQAKPAQMPDSDKITVGDLIIESAWTRQAPPNARVIGGYMTITNTGSASDRLIGGRADFARRVEVHEMSVTDGIMKMAEMENGLEIPLGATVILEPGGLHLMLMGISASPKEGETIELTLIFEKAGEVVINMPVAAIGAKTRDHGGMDHSPTGHDGSTKPKH